MRIPIPDFNFHHNQDTQMNNQSNQSNQINKYRILVSKIEEAPIADDPLRIALRDIYLQHVPSLNLTQLVSVVNNLPEPKYASGGGVLPPGEYIMGKEGQTVERNDNLNGGFFKIGQHLRSNSEPSIREQELEAQVYKLKDKLHQSGCHIDALHEGLATVKKKLELTEAQLVAKTARIDSLESSISTLSKQEYHFREECGKLHSQIDECKSVNDVLHGHVEILKQGLTGGSQRVIALEQDNAELLAGNKASAAEFGKLQQQNAELKTELESSRAGNVELKKLIEKLAKSPIELSVALSDHVANYMYHNRSYVITHQLKGWICSAVRDFFHHYNDNAIR